MRCGRGRGCRPGATRSREEGEKRDAKNGVFAEREKNTQRDVARLAAAAHADAAAVAAKFFIFIIQMDIDFIECYQAAATVPDVANFLAQRNVNDAEELNRADYDEYWRLHRIALAECLAELHPPRVLEEWQGMPPARPPPMWQRVAKEIKRLLTPAFGVGGGGGGEGGILRNWFQQGGGRKTRRKKRRLRRKRKKHKTRRRKTRRRRTRRRRRRRR